MSSIYDLVGQRLKQAREENGKTLEEVGKRIGAHKSTIQRWETGQTEKINTAALEILAQYYGVNSAWLSGKNVDKYDNNIKGDFFTFKVKDDSMFPVLIKDDIVVVKKQNDFENGDIVVAILDNNNYILRKVKKSDTKISLHAFNNNYKTLIFNKDTMTIIGIVKRLEREF